MRINRYITTYITKQEKMQTHDTWRTIDRSKSQYGQFLSLALKLSRNREVGLYEAVDKLLGHPLHGASAGCSVKWIDTDQPERRMRTMAKNRAVEAMNPDEPGGHFLPNLADVYYPNRSAELETCSMYDIASQYDFKKQV
jgi:hypothetical protein